VWEAFWHDPKFTPSLAQRRLVESGRLGRKSARGWFSHGDGSGDGAGGGKGAGNGAGTAGAAAEPHTAAPAQAPPFVTARGDLGPARELVALAREAGIEVREEPYPRQEPYGQGEPVLRAESYGRGGAGRGDIVLPSGTPLRPADAGQPGEPVVRFDLALDYRAATRIGIAPAEGAPAEAVAEATGLFQALGKKVSVIGDVPGMVVARTVAMLVDLALDAVAKDVASAYDVDTAMSLGVNYPLGPVAWGERLSAPYVRDFLDAMHLWYPTGRYAPCPELRRRAAAAEGVVSS
jgi:3-hydroxybutyryl-CoA dehydrogenase